MALEENGTKFTERIEVDEEQDVAVFRVPAHNNVEGADFYHDFKMVSFKGFLQSLFCPIQVQYNSYETSAKNRPTRKKSRNTEILQPHCDLISALYRILHGTESLLRS